MNHPKTSRLTAFALTAPTSGVGPELFKMGHGYDIRAIELIESAVTGTGTA
jgi:hypothetical protein